MKEEKYHIDYEPASAEDIIKKARELDEDYDASGFYQTSTGARILREHSYVVGNVEDIKEGIITNQNI